MFSDFSHSWCPSEKHRSAYARWGLLKSCSLSYLLKLNHPEQIDRECVVRFWISLDRDPPATLDNWFDCSNTLAVGRRDSCIQMELSSSIASYPVTGYHWEESCSLLLIPSHQEFIHIDKIPLRLLWKGWTASALSTSPHSIESFRLEMLQSFNHLYGPLMR